MCLLGAALVEVGFLLHLLLGELKLLSLMTLFELENGPTVVPQQGSPDGLITHNRIIPHRGNIQRPPLPGLLKV